VLFRGNTFKTGESVVIYPVRLHVFDILGEGDGLNATNTWTYVGHRVAQSCGNII